MMAPISSMRAGSQVDACAIASGKVVAPLTFRPSSASSPNRIGMPRRVSSTCLRCSSLAAAAASRGGTPSDESAATAPPHPVAGGLLVSTTVPKGAAVWAAFSSMVIRDSRSRTRSPIGRLESRYGR